MSNSVNWRFLANNNGSGSIYLIICFVHYNNTTCYEKKTFIEYLLDFSDNEVCTIETEPVKEVSPPPPHLDFLSLLENKKEVFHIANQDYTYEQSKCKCESYGGELATKSQIIDAYNNGAHWCTYGWSEKQSAYYPVQQCEFDKNKGINDRLPDNDKNYCGIPGINGGYFANPHLKFGVNCYGVKPQASELDKSRMASSNIVPKTKKDIITERKVAFWKENADKMLNLNPYKKGDWSVY